MDSSVSKEILDFIQKQKANFALHAFNIKFELMFQNGPNKEFYKHPVNTKECQHIQTQELDSILQSKQCVQCKKTINSYKELVMDIRWVARKIMHPDTEIVTVIKGHIFHQYLGVKFNAFFSLPQYQNVIEDLFLNKHKRNNFIELAKTDPQYNNARPTDQLTYDAICQLDFVKIQIPVRHKDCKHAGCYELTSLLFYKKEVLDSDPNKKFIECLCKCQVQFNLNTLEQDLVLDHQLLEAIRKSRPHTIKFYINPQNNELIDEYSNNGNQDHYIVEFYKRYMKNFECKSKEYQEFEQNIFKILKDIYSRKLSDLGRQVVQSVIAQSKLNEFKDQNLNLTNSFLPQLPTEYPVRCVSCKSTVCSDIRTYIGNFLIQCQKIPGEKFQCPLCKKIFTKTYINIQTSRILQDYIYLDQTLLKRLLEHREYIHTERFTFKYEGRQYMLEEFQKRHKLFTSDIKSEYQNQDINLEFKDLNCVVSGRRLTVPLQLYTCPQKYYVDFYVFYEELKKIDYDISRSLTLCKCQTCLAKPIKSINEIFFHELLQSALNQLLQSMQKLKQLLINLHNKNNAKEEVQYARLKPSLDLDSNNFGLKEEYQKCLDFFKPNVQYKATILNMTQNIGGINIKVNNQGVQCDIDEKQKQMNQAAQSDKFKQYGIKITNLKVEVKNDDFKMDNKMIFQAKK